MLVAPSLLNVSVSLQTYPFPYYNIPTAPITPRAHFSLVSGGDKIISDLKKKKKGFGLGSLILTRKAARKRTHDEVTPDPGAGGSGPPPEAPGVVTRGRSRLDSPV